MNKFISLLIVCFFYINYGTAILSSKISPKGKVMLIRHAEKPPSGNVRK